MEQPLRILRAGLFERVSTEEQSRFGFSIKTQVEALEEYCKDNKYKIVDHYTDEGVSGGKPYTKRPEMKRLLEDVQAGKIDIVLFTRLDRWFRNVKEYFKVQEILDNNRVEWKAIWEDYDTTTANGRMSITIFLAIAQNEREKTAERIKSVFENKIKNRESFFGRASTPYGYLEQRDENGVMRLVKDPELEPAIQEFWDLAVKYENVSKAMRHINLEYGLNRSKKLWFDVIHKEIYTGTYRGVENYCPAYVTKEDWDKLQHKGIKKTQCNRVYLFTGLLRCPECGHKLSSKYTIGKRQNGNVVEYKAYRCRHHSAGICDYNQNIYEIKTEKWLLKNIEELIRKEIKVVEMEKLAPKPKPKTNIPALKEQLRRLEIVYLAGNKSDAEYISEQNDLKAAIAKAESELPYDPADRDIENLKDMLEVDVVELYNSLELEDKRRFWRSLLKQIHVKGTDVVSVDFN